LEMQSSQIDELDGFGQETTSLEVSIQPWSTRETVGT
jgi:hypothetical protein